MQNTKRAVKVVLSPFTFQSCVAAFIRHVGLTVECMLTDFIEPKELKVRFRNALTDKIPKISRIFSSSPPQLRKEQLIQYFL
uniref:Uncharacterized protein n=1 Tax=Glossina pallidipes TaxID=7398 RepID=A0A1A9ZKU3_GLOPL